MSLREAAPAQQPQAAAPPAEPADITAEEWLAMFVAEKNCVPESANVLFLYARNRGSTLTYASVRRAFASAGPGGLGGGGASNAAAPQRAAAAAAATAAPLAAGAADGASPGASRAAQAPRGYDSAVYCREAGEFPPGECCAICLDADGTCVAVLCAGRHRFHRRCVDDWVRRIYAIRCPTCRQTLTPHVFESQPAPPVAHARANDGPNLQLPR
eukprot:CAMPEP_0175716048 /NCGR_PEP_ID=MMETSP0097-20121207/42943_1 /TAXON_ID=311494 /ORGANISM="Alexandrium monilatum, Strain CCMP3105" /LENGTH=213 /DNA_ID=CAMNT_0017023579 /DNA_START=30 /DNA_END=671 /DNA_ORIENTATION=-